MQKHYNIESAAIPHTVINIVPIMKVIIAITCKIKNETQERVQKEEHKLKSLCPQSMQR